MNKKTASLFVLSFVTCATVAAQNIATLRGQTDLDQQGQPPAMSQVENDDIKRKRDYPMQPPTIPHKIDNYQVDLRSNKCLSCHSWKNYREKGATKISQTHFENRDEQVLANVSARRYFCTQCHVPQVNAPPLVENRFEPITAISGE